MNRERVLMAKREKKSKIVFEKFLADNQRRMSDYLSQVEASKKYEREPWMLGSDPQGIVTPETIIELNQLGDG
jgi:hypothetical protein